jgi:uncharacterized protein (DUF58 family)
VAFSRLSYLKFLHRSYSRTGRWGWLLSRRIRSFGWGIILLVAVTTVLGTDLRTSAVFMLFCTAASLLAVTFLWVFFRSAKVSAQRDLPRYGTVDVELEYEVVVRNDGRRRIAAMLFEEWPPDPRPDFETFAHTPEPGEQLRNPVDRTLLYYRWLYLQERVRGFSAIEALQSPHELAPGESAKIRFQLKPQHRGVIKLNELRLLLPDPIGLFQRCLRINARADEIVVLPKRYPLNEFHILGSSQLDAGMEANSQGKGDQGDFTHLREYLPGDSMRTVDWKSWARTGKPIVREYEDHFIPRFGLLLDNHAPPGRAFEEAVAVASSFVALGGNSNLHLEQVWIGQNSFPLTEGGEGPQHDRLLETLATAKPQPKDQATKILQTLRIEGAELNTLLVILADWTAAQQKFVDELRKLDLETAVIVLQDKDKTAPQIRGPIHFINVDTVAKDLAGIADQLFTSPHLT